MANLVTYRKRPTTFPKMKPTRKVIVVRFAKIDGKFTRVPDDYRGPPTDIRLIPRLISWEEKHIPMIEPT